MEKLDARDFTMDEVRKRMRQNAAAVWQTRVADIEAFDPLVTHLMDACAFEFDNLSKAIEDTRHHILDRLASVMSPDVIDLPRPAHAIFHARPEEPVLDLPPQAQFFSRQTNRSAGDQPQDLFFSPVATGRLVAGDVRCLLHEQGLFQFRGRDRVQLERGVDFQDFTEYQSVFVGLELDSRVPSLAQVAFYFDWENESPRNKAAYQRKLQDPTQTRWFLNGRPLQAEAGFGVVAEAEAPGLDAELDGLHQLEKGVLREYEPCFVTLGSMPDRDHADYSTRPHPPTARFSEQQRQSYFREELLWVEIRVGRDFPEAALRKLYVRINCLPVMNRRLNQNVQRLQQSLNIYSLSSPEDFLYIRRVFDAASNDLYRSSPLSAEGQADENAFMLRLHGVGRFDVRNAREVLHYVQQMLLEESQAFSALGSGILTQTLENLTKNVEELSEKLVLNRQENFRTGHPYILVKPRQSNTTIHIEFWSTNGAAGNGLAAGTRLGLYGGNFYMRDEKEDLFLVTTTHGGREKPSVAEKEQLLRQNLLTRNRLVTREDIKAECRAYFFERVNGLRVEVAVEKAYAQGLLEGAGYLRCLDVLITPQTRADLNTAEWEDECERCRRILEEKSAMNLPYRVRLAPR